MTRHDQRVWSVAPVMVSLVELSSQVRSPSQFSRLLTVASSFGGLVSVQGLVHEYLDGPIRRWDPHLLAYGLLIMGFRYSLVNFSTPSEFRWS